MDHENPIPPGKKFTENGRFKNIMNPRESFFNKIMEIGLFFYFQLEYQVQKDES